MMALKFFTKMFSAAAATKLVLRGATAKDMDIVTRRAIKEGWSTGPYDYLCAYACNPKGCYMCEVDGQVVSHFIVTTYPNHHTHVDTIIITEEYRLKGFGKRTVSSIVDVLPKHFTTHSIGFDTVPHPGLISIYESLTCQTVGTPILLCWTWKKLSRISVKPACHLGLLQSQFAEKIFPSS